MIYPTRRAIVLIAAGAPGGAAARPARARLLAGGPAWIALSAGAGAGRRLARLLAVVGVAEPGRAAARSTSAARRRRWSTPPSTAAARRRGREVALEANARRPRRARAPAAARIEAGQLTARVHAFADAVAARRGSAMAGCAGRGPLGLVWKQRRQAFDHTAPVIPNIQAVREEAVRLFTPRVDLRPEGADRQRRGRRVPRPDRLPRRHGPPLHRLEAVGQARQADRQGIPHRAQPPRRLRRRLRPADERAGGRPAAHRPGDQRLAAAGLCQPQDRRPGRPSSPSTTGPGTPAAWSPACAPSRCCSSWPRRSTTRPRRPTSPWA